MQTSSAQGILTTHTGSLPRPPELATAMVARENGEADAATLERLPTLVRNATAEVLRRQGEAGLSVGSDGEQGKIGYSTYVKERMSGFDGASNGLALADLADYPEVAERALAGLVTTTPACTGPVTYSGADALRQELAELRSAVDAAAAAGPAPAEVFVPAASPGVIAFFLANQHYPSREAYLGALAEAMRTEYEAIVEAGFLLQIDCPDLAMGRHAQYAEDSIETFRAAISLQIEALNAATAGIDPDRMRIHLCWGNYAGPHHRDVGLVDIVDVVTTVRPRAILLEAANPRHAHEWQVFVDHPLPDDKILVPGVIDTCTTYIEHPDLVAERLVRYAEVVGIERVIGGTDCGFSTFASFLPVPERVSWAKLDTLVEGARRATRRLTGHGTRESA